MTEGNRTRIVVCKKCGIRTRHEWQRWERQGLLRVLSRTQVVEGWVCTKCGRRNRIRRAGLGRKADLS